VLVVRGGRQGVMLRQRGHEVVMDYIEQIYGTGAAVMPDLRVLCWRASCLCGKAHSDLSLALIYFLRPYFDCLGCAEQADWNSKRRILLRVCRDCAVWTWCTRDCNEILGQLNDEETKSEHYYVLGGALSWTCMNIEQWTPI
jgi:hypothetical protein